MALFNQGHYTEMETLAREMTVRFPKHGVGWKALGAALLQQGHNEEALIPLQKAAVLLQGDAQPYNNLGNTLLNLGRLSEAEFSYRQALELNPGFIEAYYNLGNTLMKLGRLPEAESSFRKALELKPGFVEALNKLGNTLQELDRLSEAEAIYQRALDLKPNFTDVYINLGIILKNQGRLSEAEASYRRALEIAPDCAEAYSKLGNTLHELGQFSEAEDTLCRALEIKPDLIEALNNLALLFNTKGEPMMALNIIGQSLQINETQEAKDIFVACIKRLRFENSTVPIRNILARAISEPWCRPYELAGASADLIRLDQNIGGCVDRAVEAWPKRLPMKDLFGSAGLAAVGADPLLCALLGSTHICDIELERFLTMARHAMLEAAINVIDSNIEDSVALVFYGALARQCFINEYVFAWTKDEADQARKLRDSLVAALEAETPVSALCPVAVAAYFPLHSLPFAGKLLDRPWPDAVTAVLVQQVREPAEERQYRSTMPHLTAIEDDVSLLVQNQYEENPYPRWVKVAPAGKPVAIDKAIRRRFPLATFQLFGKGNTTDILIAGCGTGQQSIEMAQQFQGARVLAVDLSLTSLCYAKRKTQELGLTTIEYAQADILKLGSFDRCFDVIAASGVLHHLADPMVGWKILLSLLRLGGTMFLGFYSDVALRDIVRERTFIAEQGYTSTAEDIRQCRQDLMNFGESAGFGTALKFGDFFSTSECRDLLFHVQEHHMTLADIDTFLQDNNLQFLGFEIDTHVLQAYCRRFPDDHAATNLGNWQTFENENPDTFIGMYQFWIQKVLS